MNPLEILSSVLKPAMDGLDNLFTSDDERLKAKNVLVELQNDLAVHLITYEKDLLRAKSDIIKAEANGQSWLQRSWRPITMLTFLFLVVFNSFGLLAMPLAPEMWTLLQIGLGGYVIGRSAEKTLPKVAEAVRR
jgi:hypothetical protein